MVDRYPFGYPNDDPSNGAGVVVADYGADDYRTLAELERIWQWYALNAEFRRRLVALFNFAAANGHPLGNGGGARSQQRQAELYAERNGVGVARPGVSYHEDGTPIVGAVASDLIPADSVRWVQPYLARFGLVSLAGSTPSEPWHVQLIELPRSRSTFNRNPSAYPVRRWILPDDVGAPPVTPPPPVVVTPTPTPSKEFKVEATRSTVQSGSKGAMVKRAQFACQLLSGAPALVDGDFGPMTSAAIKSLQSFCNLAADGIVGPKTWAILEGVNPN